MLLRVDDIISLKSIISFFNNLMPYHEMCETLCTHPYSGLASLYTF